MANRNDKTNVGRSVLFSQACMVKHLFYKVKVLKHSSWLIKNKMVRRTVFQHLDLHHYTIFSVPMAGWKPYAISVFLEIIKNV